MPAVKVKGNGAVVIITEDAESAGVREQGEVVAVLVAQEWCRRKAKILNC